jgi:hypothetical protein
VLRSLNQRGRGFPHEPLSTPFLRSTSCSCSASLGCSASSVVNATGPRTRHRGCDPDRTGRPLTDPPSPSSVDLCCRKDVTRMIATGPYKAQIAGAGCLASLDQQLPATSRHRGQKVSTRRRRSRAGAVMYQHQLANPPSPPFHLQPAGGSPGAAEDD